MDKELEKHIYRIQGFSCANCAKKFEQNVARLDGVAEANVNFGAAKLTVIGNTTLAELEKAGAFEQLILIPEKEKPLAQSTAQLRKRWPILSISLLLLLAGNLLGEKSIPGVIFFAAAILLGGFRLFKTGLQNLLHLDFDMKTLMTIAIIGAGIIGQWSEGAVVVILYAISEVLEGFSMDKARSSIRSMMEMSPKEAAILRNGQEILVPVEEIVIGDMLLVKPGQMIAMDGIVAEGNSAINQAAITGESVPVEKSEGDEVFAGTLNENSFLKIRVTKTAEDNTIAKIIHLVEEAQGEKAPSQRFVDRFARYYTPVIIAIAAFTAVIPPLFFQADWREWVYQGLAVLVVGCPCALVISTPVSIVTAIGTAARHGVLIKGGNYIEEAGRLKAIAFDKTGTLTKGVPAVTDFVNFSKHISDEKLLAAAAALESKSQHPVASAILRKAGTLSEQDTNEFISITGKGITGKVNGTTYFVGNEKLFPSIPTEVSAQLIALQAQGKTVIIFGTEKDILALIAVSDMVREESREVIQQLHEMGVEKTILLTGDNQKTAAAIGSFVKVTESMAGLLPEEKLSAIKVLKQKYGSAGMVGDGVNDAPALAAATVGIAMGGAGTDTALETADIVLMKDDLKKLPFVINLSRKALQIIKQNISFSIAIKILALLLVIPGWLTLWIAIFADMGTTLLVTLNGLRLLKVKETIFSNNIDNHF